MAGPVSQSLSQVANQRVNRVLAPQLAQQTSYGAHQNAVIRAFANSLLGRLQPLAEQVGGDYDAAIKQIGGLSANAASYLSGQNPAASQQQLLSSVGAPAEQQAQSQQALGNTFNGGAGVLSFTQGVVPGSELAGNKAAAMAQARTLPAIGALAGQQSLSSALYQQGQNRQTLEAKRPGLVQSEEAQIQKTNLANAAIRQRAQAATATAHYREAELKRQTAHDQAQTDLGYAKITQTAVDKAADRAATKAFHDAYLNYQKQGLSERVSHDQAAEDAANVRNAIAQQQADTSAKNAQTSRINARTARITANRPSTTAPTVHGNRQWDPKTKTWIKAPGLPATSTSSGPLTAVQRKTYTGQLNNVISGMLTGGKDPKTGKTHPALSYHDALAYLDSQGWLSSPQMRKLATSMLRKHYGSHESKIAAGVEAGPARPTGIGVPSG